eukprot:7885555-Alexandrium_andersonii.AAC.1
MPVNKQRNGASAHARAERAAAKHACAMEAPRTKPDIASANRGEVIRSNPHCTTRRRADRPLEERKNLTIQIEVSSRS